MLSAPPHGSDLHYNAGNESLEHSAPQILPPSIMELSSSRGPLPNSLALEIPAGLVPEGGFDSTARTSNIDDLFLHVDLGSAPRSEDFSWDWILDAPENIDFTTPLGIWPHQESFMYNNGLEPVSIMPKSY